MAPTDRLQSPPTRPEEIQHTEVEPRKHIKKQNRARATTWMTSPSCGEAPCKQHHPDSDPTTPASILASPIKAGATAFTANFTPPSTPIGNHNSPPPGTHPNPSNLRAGPTARKQNLVDVHAGNIPAACPSARVGDHNHIRGS